MEANNTNNDFNHKPRISFSENSSSRDGTSSNNGNRWNETHRELRRDNGKNRERGRDGEWNRDRPFHGKNSENFQDEESRERFKEEQSQQQPSQKTSNLSAYGYNTSDHPYVDNNRRALSMMSYNFLAAAMNPQWGANAIDSLPMAQNNLPVNPGSSAMPMPSGIDMAQPSGSGMNPYTFMGMPGDNMFGMMGMGNYCQYGMMNGQENVMVGPIKEVLQLSKCILYPPSPNVSQTVRKKPVGCKTVYVGGLPEKTTDEIIKEIFERCGEILTIRMNQKKFCHIRFSNESFVENAMYFSGYKIKLVNEDSSFVGTLHVDYAEARDDKYEYECQLRALHREARHRERLEQEYYSPPTPPSVVHYSELESTNLSDKLRGEETFQQAAFVLITWLERGECSKRNAGSFYSMIQSTNSHVRRLMNEKLKFEDELEKARNMLKQQMDDILKQFVDIEKVFNAACLQKVWDHFTKAQRKNIEMWKKQTLEIKNAHLEEVINERIEDEMDLSDDDNDKEDNAAKKVLDDSDAEKNQTDEFCKLQEEIDALRCQLEAAENEAIVLQSEKVRELDFKERQIQALKQILQVSKKEVSLSQKHSFDEAELNEFRAYKSRRLDKDDENDGAENSEMDNDNLGVVASTSSSTNMSISENEARLIGLISTFLHVHPFGANIDYICSYLHQIDSTIKDRDVENLMKSFPTMFREDSTGIGASLGKKWRFLGFQS